MDLQAYHWARIEDVRVTLVEMDPDAITSTYLVERIVNRPQNISSTIAFVLKFEETAIKVNGVPLQLEFAGAWPEVFVALADAVALAPHPAPGDAVTTRYEG
jgi:hypothetical protein